MPTRDRRNGKTLSERVLLLEYFLKDVSDRVLKNESNSRWFYRTLFVVAATALAAYASGRLLGKK